MIDFFAFAILIYVAAQLVIDTRKTGVSDVLFSPFWIVTLFWMIGFPLRTILIHNDIIEIQVKDYQAQIGIEYLLTALMLSFIYWLVMRFGYQSLMARRGKDFGIPVTPSAVARRSLYIARCISIGSIVLALMFIDDVFFNTDIYIGFQANEQNEARTGGGIKFLMSVFYSYSAYCLIGYYILAKVPFAKLDVIIILLFIGIGLFLGNALTSRRMMIEMPILIFMFLAYRNLSVRRVSPLLGLIIVFVILPIAQIVRYHDFTDSGLSGLVDVGIFFLGDPDFYLNSVASTTEGVDHLAQLLLNMDWIQYAFGVDYGISWIYNMGLSLIPRALWISKPEIYGSIAQQHFLYPNMYYSGAATSTIPPSFIVDFSYGWGLIFAVLWFYLFGRTLIAIERILKDQRYPGLLTIIGIYLVINSFNIFRGGTSFMSSMLVFLIPLGVTFGFRTLIHEVFEFVKWVFGITADQRLAKNWAP